MQIPEPALRSVVPVDSVAEQLADLRASLDELARDVRQAEAEADAAERRIESGDLDSPFARRTRRLSSQLVDQLRSAARDDHHVALQDARDRAAARVDAAGVEAVELVAAARMEVADALLTGSDVRPSIVDLTALRPSDEPDPSREQHPAGASIATSVPGARVIDSAVAAAVAAAVAEVDIPPPIDLTDVADGIDEATVGSELNHWMEEPPAIVSTDATSGHEEFWAEESAARPRGFSVAPIEALLPTLALLVVLVVVLVLIG